MTFRVMIGGLLLTLAGVSLGFALGAHTNGVPAYLAACLAISGLAIVFLSGTISVVTTVVWLCRRVIRR